MMRYNQQGEFNVPYGRYKAPYFPEQEIRLFAEKVRDTRTIFMCADFRTTIITHAKQSAIFYCDPPYLPASDTANFASYHTAGFGAEQHATLVKTLVNAFNEHGATSVFSGSDTPETRRIYSPFRMHEITARRSVGAKSRAEANEVIGCLKICEGCDRAGGGMCPDCGPVMGNATHSAMVENGALENDVDCDCRDSDACEDCLPFGYGWQTPWPELPEVGHE